MQTAGLLTNYYRNKLPIEMLWTWLDCPRREIAFEKDGKWRRALRFLTPEEFRLRLLKVLPDAIHVGGFYEKPITEKVPENPQVVASLKKDWLIVEREFVLDIDLTDYSDMRTSCCKDEKKACVKCWRYARIGLRILDYLLRKCFGFQRIFYVFSGRRGAHVWVLDEKARVMTEQQRAAVVDFLTLAEGSASYPEFDTVFRDVIGPFVLSEMKDLVDKVTAILATADPTRKGYLAKKEFAKACWPRLDGPVSKKLNHCLKMPYSLHPSTRNVCWLLDLAQPGADDPFLHPELFQDTERNYAIFRKATHA